MGWDVVRIRVTPILTLTTAHTGGHGLAQVNARVAGGQGGGGKDLLEQAGLLDLGLGLGLGLDLG